MKSEAETIFEMIEIMKDLDKRIASKCPNVSFMDVDKLYECCDRCPLRKKCLGDGHMDIDYDFSLEEIEEYVSFISREFERGNYV